MRGVLQEAPHTDDRPGDANHVEDRATDARRWTLRAMDRMRCEAEGPGWPLAETAVELSYAVAAPGYRLVARALPFRSRRRFSALSGRGW